jgi:putative transposase
MPNHVHPILVPSHSDGLGLAVGETHRRYTNYVNARGRWTGHLFQSRFASTLLDDDPFIRAVRYVSLNPVRARLASAARHWSSVRAHLSAAGDALVQVCPVLDRIPHLRQLLDDSAGEDFTDLRRAESTGRPLGNADFIADLERLPDRSIARRKSRPQSKERNS